MIRPDLPYRIGTRLTDEGEGEVYEAVDSRSGKPCVLKFGGPKPSLVRESEEVWNERLATEANKLKRWSRCRNVVRLLAAHLQEPRPFIVIEGLGQSLDDLIPADGFKLHQSLEMMRDVGEALVDIHRLQDAFLDVKPENILYRCATNRWTLIDPGDEDFHTYEYSSEHLSGWRRDILALGRTFIRAHTGSIDTALDEFYREWFYDLEFGDRFMRLLDRMLMERASSGRNSHPTAQTVLTIVKQFLGGLRT